MVKLRTWFRRHLRTEVFSFMGFVFSIGVFLVNLVTNRIVPMRLSLLDSETAPYVEPIIFHVPFILFSAVLLVIAATCLYLLIRSGRRK